MNTDISKYSISRCIFGIGFLEEILQKDGVR